VNVLSPENSNIIEADGFHVPEGSMIYSGTIRNKLLYRGLRQWYDTERKLQELGRPELNYTGNPYRIGLGYVSNNRPDITSKYLHLICDKEEDRYQYVIDCVKLKKQETIECNSGVGLTHSRGVTVVTRCEDSIHLKGLALLCKGKGKHKLANELEELCLQN